MKVKTLVSRILAISACLVLLLALAGCSSNASKDDDAASQNRSYMSQLNTNLDTLNAKLDEFSDAAAKGDIVSMRTAVSSAQSSINDIKNIGVPDDLKDISAAYLQALDSLQGALSQYVDSYAQMESGTMTSSDFDAQIATIQQQYTAGIDLLKKADDLAKNL